VGALLVGVTYAKALAAALRLPLIGINHLEGHIPACLLEEAQKGNGTRWQKYPVVTLVVSGGHTSLYLVSHAERSDSFPFTYQLLGKTLDDAAGEAYDKVAKLLGLGYPGGPVIDQLAPLGNAGAVSFTRPNIKSGSRYNFSFSGIKTAVARYVEKESMAGEAEGRAAAIAANPEGVLAETCSSKTLDLLASFQAAVVRNLTERTLAAAEEFGARAVFVSGGVAANSLLRKVMAQECGRQNIPLVFPSIVLSTDNAAMIAAAAYPRYQAGEFAGAELNASATLPLGA
jgi:N6-L-threonylcarbamoyladenine synthase